MKFEKKSSTATARSGPHSSRSHRAENAPSMPTNPHRAAPIAMPTRLRRWGLAGLLQGVALGTGLLCGTAHAQDASPYDSPRYPSATPADDTAVRRAPVARSEVFVDSAPDTYAVVRGDTL